MHGARGVHTEREYEAQNIGGSKTAPRTSAQFSEIFSVRQCWLCLPGRRKFRNDIILLLDIASPIIIGSGEHSLQYCKQGEKPSVRERAVSTG